MFNTEDEILRRLQEKNLEMAVMFYHWCQRNHLTCYLCGGGCIGGNPSGDLAMEKNVYWRILRKQLNLMGTWNSSYEKDEACDWTEALDALSKKKIPAQALITHCFPSEKLMDGLELMKNHKEPYCKVMVSWE